MNTYYVYIMASKKKGVLYTAVTSDLIKRVHQHKSNVYDGFTSKYKIYKLVYFVQTIDIRAAITEEKRIKGLSREKKIAIIEKSNPNWDDLSLDWM